MGYKNIEDKRANRRNYYARNAGAISIRNREKLRKVQEQECAALREEFAGKGWYFDEELFWHRLRPGKDPQAPRRELIARWKSSYGCKECGERHSGVLGFMRPDGRKMARVLAQNSVRVMRELAPLEILCMNCRSKRIPVSNPIRLRIQAAKALLGCVDCGIREGRCLQFHHPEADSKLSDVSSFADSPRLAMMEAAKCVVLCTNCHLKRHSQERKS